MSPVTVRPVRTLRELDLFARLPFRLYRNDPNWVPPLVSDFRKSLTPAVNPFWQHADRSLYLAERNGEPVGRIAAIVDRSYNDHHHSSTEFFGYFESIENEETALSLLRVVEEDAARRRITRVYGPANPSLNDEAGMLVDPFDSPPMLKMSYNPPFYPRLLEKAGYSKVKDLYAYVISTSQPVPRKLEHVMSRLKQKPGIKVRPLDVRHLSRELGLVREVYNDAWSSNWDFAPMTEEEIAALAGQLQSLLKPELCPLVFCDGEIAGMAVALPDYNQVLKHMNGAMLPFGWLKFLLLRNRISQARLWALGVKRKFHGLGFDSLLYYEAFTAARQLGYSRGEVSWILEDNTAIIRPVQMWGGELYKTYRIYGKEVSGA